MRYQQFRLAKRDGEIVQQSRYVTTSTKSSHPWWNVLKWGEYDVDYDYTEWTDVPFVEIYTFKSGDRVRVKQNSGFHKGATGTVAFVEPLGKVWVVRDGAMSSVYFHSEELEPENGTHKNA